MSKHSPGPWRIVTGIRNTSYQDHLASVIDANGDIVCDNEAYYPHEVDPLNMPLIAAAPELYEALVGMINAFDCDDLVARDESIGSNSGDRVYSVIKAARSAIAKARTEITTI